MFWRIWFNTCSHVVIFPQCSHIKWNDCGVDMIYPPSAIIETTKIVSLWRVYNLTDWRMRHDMSDEKHHKKHDMSDEDKLCHRYQQTMIQIYYTECNSLLLFGLHLYLFKQLYSIITPINLLHDLACYNKCFSQSQLLQYVIFNWYVELYAIKVLLTLSNIWNAAPLLPQRFAAGAINPLSHKCLILLFYEVLCLKLLHEAQDSRCRPT